MSAPRRALTGTLLRAAAQSSLRASKHTLPRAAVAPACRAWQPKTVPRSVASLRWYSSDAPLPGSRMYSFQDVEKQLKINDELQESGAEETASGDKKVIFVGAYHTSPTPIIQYK